MRRRGNVALLFALGIAVLFGSAAIAVDTTWRRNSAFELQNAADAAAHAGAVQLDGTEAGRERALRVAREVAARNWAGGAPVNPDEVDIEFGSWNEQTRGFDPAADAATTDTVRVRARVPALPLFFSGVAFGTTHVPLQAVAATRAIASGAGAVDHYLPLALPACLVDRYGVSGLNAVDFKLNPPGIDNMGWARPNGSPNASWTRDQIRNQGASGRARVGDPVGLQNGVVTSAMSEIITTLYSSPTRWSTSRWGAQPARMSGSSVSATFYGRTLEGVVIVFDGGPEYCQNSGGQFNQSHPIAGFLWGAIYDIKNSGSSSSRTIKMRLDTMDEHALGTEGDGPDWGVVAKVAPRMVQ